MGSFFAGVKAGTLSGMLYIGGLALSLVLVLYLFRGDAVSSLLRSFDQFCVVNAPVNSTVVGSGQDCFDQLIQNVIPAGAILGYFVSLGYAGVLGLYYEAMPGRRPAAKALPVAAAAGLTILVLGLDPLILLFDFAALLFGILVVWTAVFAVSLGALYRRYTRAVRVESQDPSLLRVFVDGRDVTGKERTFALTSSHRLRAEVASDASFKVWEATGELGVEDPRSFETVVEVNGAGTLRGSVAPKH